MKTIGMLAGLLVVMVMGMFNVAQAEQTCEEYNFAVMGTPIRMNIKMNPCARIITPADTFIEMYITEYPAKSALVKVDDQKFTITNITLRTGGKPGVYEVYPVDVDPNKVLPYLMEVRVNDTPKHIRGGTNALWYGNSSQDRGSQRISILADFTTQTVVPRGYNLKVMTDAPATVRYGGVEKECQPEEIVEFAGVPGCDLLEIVGRGQDGIVAIGATPRKIATIEQPGPAKKKTAAKRK